jgi:hypothetical protein
MPPDHRRHQVQVVVHVAVYSVLLALVYYRCAEPVPVQEKYRCLAESTWYGYQPQRHMFNYIKALPNAIAQYKNLRW